MSTLLAISFSILGFLLFLFFYWRRLKEDYISGKVFSSGFYIAIGVLLGIAGLNFFTSGLWFWGGLLGFGLGLFLSLWRFKLRFFETLEAAGVGMLFWLGVIFALDAFANSSLSSLYACLVIGGLIFLFFFLEARYKDFSWYKSGKVGFSGLTSLGFFFLIRAFVAFFFPFVLSFVGKIDVILSAIIAFALFYL